MILSPGSVLRPPLAELKQAAVLQRAERFTAVSEIEIVQVGESTLRAEAPAPVIPQLAERLDKLRKSRGNPISGPILSNSRGNPLDLNGLYWREMRTIFAKAGIRWVGWHGFRRGLASNLNRLGKAGGEGGIRTLDTGFGPYNGLANRRLQPLGHLSGGFSTV